MSSSFTEQNPNHTKMICAKCRCHWYSLCLSECIKLHGSKKSDNYVWNLIRCRFRNKSKNNHKNNLYKYKQGIPTYKFQSFYWYWNKLRNDDAKRRKLAVCALANPPPLMEYVYPPKKAPTNISKLYTHHLSHSRYSSSWKLLGSLCFICYHTLSW